ncbi:MAG: tRNA (adenosine(37)-N6)-threonylcarbamoyltransferase complex dimerization subunit type 1 TsaB [Rickettsiales bacterium]
MGNNNEVNNILAVDSSTGACSVAVYSNGDILSYLEINTPSLQARELLPMIESALGESKIAYKDLSTIVCTVGPGSFTGVRIGLSAARAIGFAAGVKVIGFSSLEVLAYEAITKNNGKPVMAVLNAGKGEVVYQNFSRDFEVESQAELIKSDILANSIDGDRLVVGFGSGSDIVYPKSNILAKLAYSYPEKAVPPVPFYVRPPDAKLPTG